MSGELGEQAPKVELSPTPRSRLEKFLEKEKPGSIKSQAFLDMARSEYLEDRIRRSTKEAGRMPQLELDQYIAEQAAVNETIRVRKFGENGTEYNMAFEDSDSLWLYRDYCTAQVPPGSEYEPSFYSGAAIMAIEKDMLSINAIKKSQGQ